MIKKEFTYTKRIEKKVTKKLPVFDSGTLLKCTTAYTDFKVGEIILVHKSMLNDHQYPTSSTIVYEVTWFYIHNGRGKCIAPRIVTINENNFIECSFDDLKKYIKDNNT